MIPPRHHLEQNGEGSLEVTQEMETAIITILIQERAFVRI